MINRTFNALRNTSPWFWLILLLAAGLRLWLAAYNTDANDSHLEVIQRIMASGELPVAGDCWQCYHVKAFHYPAAVALARLAIHNPIDQLLALQLGNALLGVATLLLLWAWLRGRDLAARWRLMLFALIALNPRLAAINVQVTNDTLVIFAASACLLCYTRFLERRQFGYLWAALAFSALALASKASGIVIAILLLGHLALLALGHLRRLPRYRKQAVASALVALIVFAPVPFSGYLQNHAATGSALANNIEKFPLPNWSEEQRWSKAGVTSIVDSFLTFRWPGLLAYPYITKGPVMYPEHRTNLWAQLFGRQAFSRFDHWPASWATNGWWTTRVGQTAMLLGLVPLVLLLVGSGAVMMRSIAMLRGTRPLQRLSRDPELFLAAAFAAMLAMSLKLSLDFQTYRIMKAIYLYPGLLGGLALLARGAGSVLERLPPLGGRLLHRLLLGLVAVHVLDLAILGTDLQARYADQAPRLAAYEAPRASGPGQQRLGELRPAVGRGSQALRVDEGFSGQALTGGYRKFRHGFGTHALSFVAFALDGQYTRFGTAMALADEAASSDGVRFEIWGDSRLLYRSPNMIDHQLETVTVDVTGVDKLALKVQPLGSSHGDLANWLAPVLTRKR